LTERLIHFPQIIAFVQQHAHADVQQLLLNQHKYPNIPVREAALQIQARQKAQHKLPSWFAQTMVCYPSLLSMEQCSSETTAQFKASLTQGHTLIDLTGGMGVDTSAFSHRFTEVVYIEQNTELQEITQYNLAQLGITNVSFVNARSEEWLHSFSSKADWIYLDPARRNDTGGKVVRLQDCEPQILTLQNLLFQKADNILLKASPMLDIDLALRELKQVATVYVLAVENEVKELLFHLTPSATGEPEIVSVNLPKPPLAAQEFRFQKSEEAAASVTFSGPLAYLYESNAAILKAGAFRSVAARLGLFKLHPNSHLYTSATPVENFPGRNFKLLAVCKLDKKELSRYLPEGKASIAVRNFPMTVADIRKKTGLHDGGDKYLFATTDWQNRKVVLVCVKKEER
jgi:16S rRNA G966 N2-methylase RsmD